MILNGNYNEALKSKGLKWFFFEYRLDLTPREWVEFSFTSTYPVHFYLKNGYKNEVNRFDYDMIYKN